MDHQHGLVTGFAIDKGVDLWFNVNGNENENETLRYENENQNSKFPIGRVHLVSKTFEGEVEFDIDQPSQVREHHWGDYARGAKYALRKRFELKRGIDGVIQGSLPVGGLSSSAAVLIAYVMAFAKANDITLQPFEVVKIASEAEREYIGLNNGLLDQACIALGKKDGLLFLDCDSNDWRIIKRHKDMPDFEIGIFFSGLTRSLVNSDYNLRVYECKTAAWNMLAYTDQPLKTFDKTFLRDIPKATYEKTRIAMPQRFARRAEHFYSEYRRVRQGVTAWETGNMKLFGKLSFDSCESSIHNYECGSPELIAIYEIMRELPGVYGTRYNMQQVGSVKIVTQLAKDKNALAVTRATDYVRKLPGRKKMFLLISCYNDEKIWSENTCWLYDCDFEMMNDPLMDQIVATGPRALDFKLRLLWAGIPEEKILCIEDEREAARKFDLKKDDSVYIFCGIDAFDLVDDCREIIKKRVTDEGL